MVALVGWMGVARRTTSRRPSLLVVLVGVVATVNLIGPYLVMLLGFVVASASRRFPTLLAARRLIDDPRSTWRAVSAVGLGVIVAGLSTMVAGSGDAGGPEGYEYLGADMATGAYLTLAIIAVVSATSTGVVQAARVLDQREQYRALALAGAGEPALHAARTREVALPLAVTVAVAGGMVLALTGALLARSDRPGAAAAVRGGRRHGRRADGRRGDGVAATRPVGLRGFPDFQTHVVVDLARSRAPRSTTTRVWKRSGSGRDQAGLVGQDHGLDAVAQVQLAQDRPEVGLDRGLGQVQPPGDLLVAQPLTHGDQDLALALGESRQPVVRPARRAGLSPAGARSSAPGRRRR